MPPDGPCRECGCAPASPGGYGICECECHPPETFERHPNVEEWNHFLAVAIAWEPEDESRARLLRSFKVDEGP